MRVSCDGWTQNEAQILARQQTFGCSIVACVSDFPKILIWQACGKVLEIKIVEQKIKFPVLFLRLPLLVIISHLRNAGKLFPKGEKSVWLSHPVAFGFDGLLLRRCHHIRVRMLFRKSWATVTPDDLCPTDTRDVRVHISIDLSSRCQLVRTASGALPLICSSNELKQGIWVTGSISWSLMRSNWIACSSSAESACLPNRHDVGRFE